MLRFRAGTMVVSGRGSGACRPGLLALRSTSGLGLPHGAAGLPRQRSTGLVRRSGRPGDSCPGFAARLVLNVAAGSLSPLLGRKVWGTPAGAGKRWSGCLRLVTGGVLAGTAGRSRGIPAGAVDDHGADPAQQRGGARDPGGGVPCPGCGRRRRGRLRPGTVVRAGRLHGSVGGAGQRLVLGRHHGIEPQHRPYRAPYGQPQAGPAAAGDVRLAGQGARGVV